MEKTTHGLIIQVSNQIYDRLQMIKFYNKENMQDLCVRAIEKELNIVELESKDDMIKQKNKIEKVLNTIGENK